MDGNVRGRVEHVHDAPVSVALASMQVVRRSADMNPSGPGRSSASHRQCTAGSKTRIRTAASSSR